MLTTHRNNHQSEIFVIVKIGSQSVKRNAIRQWSGIIVIVKIRSHIVKLNGKEPLDRNIFCLNTLQIFGKVGGSV